MPPGGRPGGGAREMKLLEGRCARRLLEEAVSGRLLDCGVDARGVRVAGRMGDELSVACRDGDLGTSLAASRDRRVPADMCPRRAPALGASQHLTMHQALGVHNRTAAPRPPARVLAGEDGWRCAAACGRSPRGSAGDDALYGSREPRWVARHAPPRHSAAASRGGARGGSAGSDPLRRDGASRQAPPARRELPRREGPGRHFPGRQGCTARGEPPGPRSAPQSDARWLGESPPANCGAAIALPRRASGRPPPAPTGTPTARPAGRAGPGVRSLRLDRDDASSPGARALERTIACRADALLAEANALSASLQC